MYKNKVLVTGGAGFIGSFLVKRLIKNGHHVTILDDLSTGNIANLKDLPKENYDFVKGNILDEKILDECTNSIDYVFHLAAICSVQETIRDPIHSFRVNSLGTLNVLKASLNNAVKKVIFSSSCAVYGDTTDIPINENTTTNPMTPYAVQKRVSEDYCLLFNENLGLETTCLRYFNVYGPNQNADSEYSAVIPKFIDLISNNKRPTIFGDGSQTRDFIFVEDIVDANIFALGKESTGLKINIGSGESVKINEIVSNINEILQMDIEPNYKDKRAGDILHSRANISLANEIMNFRPIYNLKSGLFNTITYNSGV